MKKLNLWVFLAVVYIAVIGVVIFYRMNKKTEKPITTVPEVTVAPSPTVVTEELMTELNGTIIGNGLFDVSLLLFDPAAFESAGYTVEVIYDPAVLKVADISEGNIWSENIVLQKDTATAGKVVYSLGRGLQAGPTGDAVMATVSFLVVDESADETEISVSSASKSASDKSVKTIVAQPLILKLK